MEILKILTLCKYAVFRDLNNNERTIHISHNSYKNKYTYENYRVSKIIQFQGTKTNSLFKIVCTSIISLGINNIF